MCSPLKQPVVGPEGGEMGVAGETDSISDVLDITYNPGALWLTGRVSRRVPQCVLR